MKKIIVSMMLSGALLTCGSAFAQTKTDGTTGATTNKACSKEVKACKGNKPCKPAFNPFDGVQLTADQQQKLQILQQGLGPVVLDKAQKDKIKENPNLTPEQKKQLKEERKASKQEAKKKYLNGVKETLTPEQYVIFLENCYLYSPKGQGYTKDGGMKPGKIKKDKKGHHAGKDNKGGKDKGDKKK